MRKFFLPVLQYDSKPDIQIRSDESENNANTFIDTT